MVLFTNILFVIVLLMALCVFLTHVCFLYCLYKFFICRCTRGYPAGMVEIPADVFDALSGLLEIPAGLFEFPAGMSESPACIYCKFWRA